MDKPTRGRRIRLTDPRRCTQCHRYAPEDVDDDGRCPVCVIQLVLDIDVEEPKAPGAWSV